VILLTAPPTPHPALFPRAPDDKAKEEIFNKANAEAEVEVKKDPNKFDTAPPSPTTTWVMARTQSG